MRRIEELPNRGWLASLVSRELGFTPAGEA
jgi:hypothetical protein